MLDSKSLTVDAVIIGMQKEGHLQPVGLFTFYLSCFNGISLNKETKIINMMNIESVRAISTGFFFIYQRA